MKSMKSKLLLLLFPVTLAMLAAVGYFNFFKTTELFTRSTQAHLHSVVEAKQVALIEHIKATEKIGAAIAINEDVQTYVEFINRNLSGRNQETVDRLGQRVDNLLYSLQESHWGPYHHIFLISRSNRIVISPNHGAKEKGAPSALLDQDMSANPWAMRAMQKGVTTLSGYSKRRALDHGQLVLFVPVRDASNRIQAVIGIQMPVAYQQKILTQGIDFDQIGRIYLTTDKGGPLAQKGIANQAPLTGDALSHTRLNGNWSGRRMGSRGREVFGVYAKHQQYPWILAAEIETEEVFVDLYNLQAILIGGLVATLVVVLLLSLRFVNAVSKPLRELTAYVEKISLGKFNIDIPDTRRKDEVGKLTEALQQLVFSLQLVSKKLREAKALKTKIMKAKSMKRAS